MNKLSKESKADKELDVEYVFYLKGEEEKKKASQKKGEESRPLSWKENYDQVNFADRLQMTACCLIIRKTACIKCVSSWS